MPDKKGEMTMAELRNNNEYEQREETVETYRKQPKMTPTSPTPRSHRLDAEMKPFDSVGAGSPSRVSVFQRSTNNYKDGTLSNCDSKKKKSSKFKDTTP